MFKISAYDLNTVGMRQRNASRLLRSQGKQSSNYQLLLSCNRKRQKG